MSADTFSMVFLAVSILAGLGFAAIMVVRVFVKAFRQAIELQKEKESQNQSEPASPVKVRSAEFWRLEEQRAFAEAKAKSEGLRILPGDLIDEKERKKAAKEAVWIDHDAKKSQILLEEVYQTGVKIGMDFFRDLEADSDAIGWSWDVRSDSEVCDHCKSLEGTYSKGVRIKYPAHIGCRCSLSVVYKGSGDVKFRQYELLEGSK